MGMALVLSLLLAGCGIGGYSMTGMVLEKDLKSIKPYIAYWTKDGMTIEERREDSVNCGSIRGRLDEVVFSKEQIAAAHLPGETSTATYHRLRFDWQRCMLKNGYRFTGDCRVEFPDSPVSCK